MEAISNSIKVNSQPTQTSTAVTNTVNFRQASGQDTVEISSKKEKGMSTGAKIAIGSVLLLGGAAAIDAIFNHGKLLNKIFKKAGNEVAEAGEKIQNKLVPTIDEAKTSFEKAQEFFKKNPDVTSWTDDAGMVYTRKINEFTSYGKDGKKIKSHFGVIEGVLKDTDGNSVKLVYSGGISGKPYREISNSRGTLVETWDDLIPQNEIKDNIISVVVDGHKINLNLLNSSKEQFCFVSENGVMKTYPKSVFDQAKEFVQNGTKWEGLDNIKPLEELKIK